MKNLFGAQRALLTLLVVSFVTLFSVGCGNSNQGDFVFTGTTDGPAPTTGNLVFQFEQAPVTQTTVPVGTTTLRFDLYAADSANPDNLFLTATFGYSDTIVIRDVPSQVRFVVVTFFNSDGLPLATRSAAVEVEVGVDNNVTLGDAVPVPFEAINVTPDPVNLVLSVFNPQRIAEQQLALTGTFGGNLFFLPINAGAVTFEVANDDVANISSSGLVSAERGGHSMIMKSDIRAAAYGSLGTGANTTATASYTFNGVTQQDIFDINLFSFSVIAFDEPALVPGGSYTDGYASEFVGADGVVVPVANQLSFSLQNPVEGVAIDPVSGDITTTAATPLGEFVVVITWVDQRPNGTGLTFTDTETFTVASVI